MLLDLLYPLKDAASIFNLFRYITVRSAGASVTAFIICLWLGPRCIEWLRGLKLIASIKRAHAPQLDGLRQDKKQTPSMGGLLIVIAVVLANLLWGDLHNKYLLLIMFVFVALGLIGFMDDYLKIAFGNSKGLSARAKLIGQITSGLFLGLFLYFDPDYQKHTYIPFVKDAVIYFGVGCVAWIAFIIVSSSNAINVTDGLDGLAIGCSLFVVGTFAILAYVGGNMNFSHYLNIPYVRGTGELTVFCASLVGAGLGFLWFNSPPAQVFMGDTGSLALGGAIGTIAVLIKCELLLIIIGGVFVWEALSVIIQVWVFKRTGKRFFKMAPFHHHLQLNGWPESKITIRLWIISFILAVIGLSTLKLR